MGIEDQAIDEMRAEAGGDQEFLFTVPVGVVEQHRIAARRRLGDDQRADLGEIGTQEVRYGEREDADRRLTQVAGSRVRVIVERRDRCMDLGGLFPHSRARSGH